MKAVVLILFLLVSTVTFGCSGGFSKADGIPNLGQSDNHQGQPPKNVVEKVKSASEYKTIVGKKVYLTLDDGPDSINTPMVLDILDSYGVKATFFLIGTNIERHPEIVRDIVKRGHSIGNHTYNHKYKDIYSSANGFMQSVKRNEEVIYKVTGERPVIVRDPGGIVRNNGALKTTLLQNGYRLEDWNVDSYDSRSPSPLAPQIIENIRQQVKKKDLWPKMIILMHDGKGHMSSVRALPTVIELLLSEGFQFDVLK